MGFFSKIKKLSANNKGSTVIEFALVMPVVVMATLMIFDMGRVILAYSSVNDVASDTARYASIHGPVRGGGLSDAEIINYAESNIAGLELSLIETTITWSANKARGSTVTVRISSDFEFFVTRFIDMNAFTIRGEASTTVL
ncbi:MAG: pilus assembly protein [Sphingomonadales bacterium]|nr:pilus assembly protein [Sphingomonadales bacterium]